jgi:hypothetical protein
MATKNTPMNVDVNAAELPADVVAEYESLLRRATGRGGWEIKRITSDGTSVTVHYTDTLAEFGYAVSPDMNAKPRVRVMKFAKK